MDVPKMEQERSLVVEVGSLDDHLNGMQRCLSDIHAEQKPGALLQSPLSHLVCRRCDTNFALSSPKAHVLLELSNVRPSNQSDHAMCEVDVELSAECSFQTLGYSLSSTLYGYGLETVWEKDHSIAKISCPKCS